MALREKTEYTAAVAVLALTRILPEAAIYTLFKGFALSFHAISGRRRNLALRNTGIAFPEKPLKERKALVLNSFTNLGKSMAFNTLVLTGRISNKRMLSCIETKGVKRLEKRLSKSKKGVLCFSCHVGNWELIPQFTALHFGSAHVIYRKTNNPLLEERIVRPLRERFGVNMIYKKNALVKILKAVNKGEIAGMMVDQKLKPPAGIPIDFFGKTAPTVASPALFQIRFGITVIPSFMIRTGHQKYCAIYGDPIEWNDNGKPLEEQVAELTRLHQKVIEEIILKYPDQWFWMHNRWGLPKAER